LTPRLFGVCSVVFQVSSLSGTELCTSTFIGSPQFASCPLDEHAEGRGDALLSTATVVWLETFP
jgi:hypothetical protein